MPQKSTAARLDKPSKVSHHNKLQLIEVTQLTSALKMGKINGCLKCLFIFFNVVFAIVGCLLIFGLVKASIYSNQLSAVGAPGLGWGWVFAIGVLGISCLGIYAGSSEKELALKIFAGFMGVGMIIMLIFGIVVVVMRNKVRDNFRSASSEVVKPYMAQEGFRIVLNELQHTGQCCGLTSASDWGDDIPSTCECQTGSFGAFGKSECKARPQGTTGPNQIYAQTCGEFIIIWSDFLFNVTMGVLFSFAVTALLGLLVSLLMIHQVRRHDQGGASSMAMKGY
ncbi:tetraspanin-8-like [Dunckerocampus dactyliophorus]|uniref:tetraspanin-8-like n=1 Tax=Dunckerocampus dactyliophorus TaxID=161453 RepID=UPI002405292A|nr:tetraspanin-8-like [Dunckerocampus dactyliophorus]